jgi:hypothetical protein
MNASICTLGKPGRRRELASGAGSLFTTINALTLPMAANRPLLVDFNAIETDQQVQAVA